MNHQPTHIVLRDGKPIREKNKRCLMCGKVKLVSEDLSLSEFAAAHRDRAGRITSWQARCRPCWREHHRVQMTAWRLKNPKGNRSIQRAWRVQQAEKQGRPIPINLSPRKRERVRVMIGPFRAWLREYQNRTGLERNALAMDLGFGGGDSAVRRLWAYVDDPKQQFVALDTVDRALIHASALLTVTVNGRAIITLDDLYPPEEKKAA